MHKNFLSVFRKLGEYYKRKNEIDKAIDCYEKGVANRSALACYQLGEIFLRGKWKPANYAKAKEYLEMAMDRGQSESLASLAWMYQKGLGVAKDSQKAFLLLEKSAQEGNVVGYIAMATMYMNGDGVEKDLKKAFECVKRGADEGEPNSCNILGELFISGRGTQVDLEEAANYLHKAYKSTLNLGFNSFQKILHSGQVSWRKEFHEYWKGETGLNEQILCLLLSSKSKSSSTNHTVKSILVTGVVLNIVKFLCHLRQNIVSL